MPKKQLSAKNVHLASFFVATEIKSSFLGTRFGSRKKLVFSFGRLGIKERSAM